jgi:hypothetical protein
VRRRIAMDEYRIYFTDSELSIIMQALNYFCDYNPHCSEEQGQLCIDALNKIDSVL